MRDRKARLSLFPCEVALRSHTTSRESWESTNGRMRVSPAILQSKVISERGRHGDRSFPVKLHIDLIRCLTNLPP